MNRLLNRPGRGSDDVQTSSTGRGGDPATSSPPARTIRSLIGSLSAGRRWRLTAIVVTSFIGGLLEAATLLLIARIAFALTRTDKSVPIDLGSVIQADLSIAALIAIAAAFVVLRLGAWMLTVREQTRLAADVLLEIRSELVARYLGASWALQAADRDGRLQELVATFATQAAAQMGSLASLLAALCSLVAMLSAAMFSNALATVLVGVAGIGLILIMRPIRAAVKRRSRHSATVSMEYATAVSEVASMAQEIHVFGVGAAVDAQLHDLGVQARRASERLQRLAQLMPAVYQTLALLVVVGAIWLVYEVGGTRLASLGAVVLIGVRSLSYGQAVHTSYQALHVGAPYLEILEDERARLADAAVLSGTKQLDRIDEITFDDVSFTYETASAPALSSVSFTASRGQIIGIVGPSGAGKSTLVQLLLRLREPTSGRVLVDGVDVRDTSLGTWTRLVTFVPQDAHLFNATVERNIRFYRDVGQAELEAAARLAHIHDEIVSWTEGYQTIVGERGRHLSGGQRQRVTIARALVGEPDVVVLDEPTSNLDVHSEAAIRATLLELAERAVVFVVAHRLSTLDVCSRIMVIQDGHLRGFDEPRRLEATSTFYREALRLSGLR
jgi:ABC-type multidrug transport system fused ATPase/permease subunit